MCQTFYVASDLNIEWGLPCTGDDDDEELCGMYGPRCWQGCEADPGGFQILMWYDIMKRVQLQCGLHMVEL